MSKFPLVSVIITTYNRSQKVANCINGVLRQDYDNVEIIVVDDYSTDDTESFLKKNYLNEVKYVRHNFNQGVQFASNTGYRHASGKYVAFIGDDDVWSNNNKLSEQVKIFENDYLKKYGIVTTDVKIITKEKSYKKNIKKPKNLVKHILNKNGIIYGSAALIRSDIFKQVGMFAKDLPRGTDSDVFRRIILLGYDVYFIEKDMVDYYFDGINQMTTFNEKGINRAIIGELYKLKTYNEIYKSYPNIRSLILFRIGQMYYLRYNSNKNYLARDLTRKYLFKSIFSNPLNYWGWFLLIKLYLGIK
ncbi:glycosyltransferase [Candidatus Pelagibacter ubique]|nr:glycosyltransferase [Candidatus Pelagibacter ubique]